LHDDVPLCVSVWGHGHLPTNGDAAPNIDDYNSYDDYNDAYDDSNT
jgi:hypothetical protein